MDEPKNPVGRPSKYRAEYCDEIIRFFDREPYRIDDDGKRVANDFPFLIDFAMKIGVCHDTLIEWTKVHPEFSEAYKKAQKLAEKLWATNSLLGLYNPAFTIFMGKNVFKWHDKQTHVLEGGLNLRTNLTEAEEEALQNAADAFAKKVLLID